MNQMAHEGAAQRVRELHKLGQHEAAQDLARRMAGLKSQGGQAI